MGQLVQQAEPEIVDSVEAQSEADYRSAVTEPECRPVEIRLSRCFSITIEIPCFTSIYFAIRGPFSDQLSLATFVMKSKVTVPRS